MTTTMNDETSKILLPSSTTIAPQPLIDSTNPPDPNLVFGANGFTIRKPFPYKNPQGDIFCIVCCLQKGELVFQPKANFKIFRERGAVIGENSDRSALVEKLFGFKNVCGGRLCDSHYRYIMKFKNKFVANDSPTSNSIDGEAPTTKRKKRKTDQKTITDTDSSTTTSITGAPTSSGGVTRKKKKEQQQQYVSELNDSSVDIASINHVNSNIPNNSETNEKEIDEQSINSSSYQVIVNEPNSTQMMINNHTTTTYSNSTSYRSSYDTAREERYAAKRRFNFLVRLVEEMVDEEEIHYQYQLYLKQQQELKRNPSLRYSNNTSLEYLDEDDGEEDESSLSC